MITVSALENSDCSYIIEKVIASAEPYETICFESGEYFLSKRINVRGKKHLKLLGNNTTFVSYFDPSLSYENYNGVFSFEDCEDITIENFHFDTNCPSNASGKIFAINKKERSIDVELYDGNVMDGSQKIVAINSMDADGTPDYLLSPLELSSYEVLDEKSIRVFLPEDDCKIEKLPIGEQVCFRHALGSYLTLTNATIIFKGCSDVTMIDINVHSSVGFMTVLFPRCHNFTFIRYNIVPKPNAKCLMASNIDAIHIFGLTGTLNVMDCCFSGLGDDAINIHSTAGYVTNTKNDCIDVQNKRFECPLEREWCSAGDIINVYNSEFVCKGNFTVENYDGNSIKYSSCNCTIDVGDFLANTAYFAKTVITNCKIRNSRARGLLLQTENIQIKNCEFYGISLSAILLSPDIRRWYEMGPVKNVLIQNCRFEKCAIESSDNGNSVISVKTAHDISGCNENVVHNDIKILNNDFVECDKLFSICSTDGVLIEGNKFVRSGKLYRIDKNKNELKLSNCKNCIVEKGSQN